MYGLTDRHTHTHDRLRYLYH